MIFVTLGSQKFQFNRLLKELDRIIDNKELEDEVFAQIGYSDYKPRNFKYKEFLDREEFYEIMNKCSVVIAHGGTGAIVTAVKKNKKVIGVPRIKEFGEHVDNHQIQIVKEFDESGMIKAVYNIEDLEKIIKNIKKDSFDKYNSNTQKIIEDIEEFIKECNKK